MHCIGAALAVSLTNVRQHHAHDQIYILSVYCSKGKGCVDQGLLKIDLNIRWTTAEVIHYDLGLLCSRVNLLEQ